LIIFLKTKTHDRADQRPITS